MNTQQLDTLKKKLKVAETELKMREKNRNASEKGYLRIVKQVEELKRRIEHGRKVVGSTK